MNLSNAGSGAGGSLASLPALSLDASLCGVDHPSCDPDDSKACSSVTFAAGGASVSGGVTTPELARAGAGWFGAAGTLGKPGGVSGGGNGGTGTTIGSLGRAGSPVVACRVTKESSGRTTQCELAGQGRFGAPCFSRTDCAPGLACVEGNGTAQCRPYCCRGVDSCPTGTFCDQRLTRELGVDVQPMTISACMPATDCQFDDPYPCPLDRTCSCPSGTACGVVRSDGTTACIAPGAGVEGQPCPCAAGHVCSDALRACLKVCRLTSKTPTCGDGICQESANLSSEWGVCVSAKALD